MSEKLLLSLMALIIFVFSFFLFPIRYGLGCENNLETCESDEITRQYMREYDEEAIREQQELLDFYNSQKKLESIETQETNPEKEEPILEIKGKEPEKDSPMPEKKKSTVKNLEQAGKQIAKETTRVVRQTHDVAQKTNREVKRILKF